MVKPKKELVRDSETQKGASAARSIPKRSFDRSIKPICELFGTKKSVCELFRSEKPICGLFVENNSRL